MTVAIFGKCHLLIRKHKQNIELQSCFMDMMPCCSIGGTNFGEELKIYIL